MSEAVSSPANLGAARAEVDQPRAIAASILIAIAGWIVFMAMPILVGALADLRGYSEASVGYLASAELGGMFLASIFVSLSVGRLNRRWAAVAGLALSLAINLLSTQVTAYGPFMALRVFAGFGAGLCYSLAIANLAASEERARNFSYLIFVLVAVNAVELYTFPQLTAAWGVNAIFLAFAAFNLLSFAFIRYLPAHIAAPEPSPQSASAPSMAPPTSRVLPWLCLFAITSFYVCIGGFWAYIERLGVDRGLDPQFIAITLSLTTVFSLAGCYGAYWLSKRAGQSVPLVFAFGTIGAAVLAMGLVTTPTIYFLGLVVFQLLWNAADIYQLGTLSNIDRIGRYGALVPGAQGLGQTIGPAGAGTVLALGSGYAGVMSFVAGAAFLAMVAYGLVHVRLQRTNPALAAQ